MIIILAEHFVLQHMLRKKVPRILQLKIAAIYFVPPLLYEILYILIAGYSTFRLLITEATISI